MLTLCFLDALNVKKLPELGFTGRQEEENKFKKTKTDTNLNNDPC